MNEQPGQTNPVTSAEQASVYLQALMDSMAKSIKEQSVGYKNLLLFSQEFVKITNEIAGIIGVKTAAAGENASASFEEFMKTAKRLEQVDKATAAAMYKNKMKDVQDRIVAEGQLSDANRDAIVAIRNRVKAMSKTSTTDALTDLFTKQIPGLSPIIAAFSKMSVGALVITGLVEAIKELWQYSNLSAKAVNLNVMQGGILNDSLTRSAATTKNFYSSFVDPADSMATASTILKNYGGTVANSAAEQDSLTEDLANTSIYLAKMGPMFGMTGEQLGQTMGQLSARFHMSMKELIPAFESTARLAMGLGISTTDLSNIFLKSGDQLRWFAGKGGLTPVMSSFGVLGKQMLTLSSASKTFWSNLKPGEFIDIMQKVTDLWSKTGAETYIAMQAGSAPTTMAGLAGGIEEFYTKGPVEALRTIATGYTEKLTAAGMSQRDAFLMLSRTGPFAELGRAAPAMLEALTSMTEKQLRATGTADSMDGFLSKMAERFPQQAKDLERLRETQTLMEDPMKLIARTIQKLLTVVTSIAAAPLLRGAGAAAAVGSLLTGEQSSATRSLDRPRGIQ